MMCLKIILFYISIYFLNKMYVYMLSKSDVRLKTFVGNCCNNYAYRYFVNCFGMALLFYLSHY